ncbi:Inter-alpha-trypsin inhibitor heavy chain H3 [Tolypocladium capitatum]|uniref:Inter-alpha-trypsin inhibitor heavy chain H3 n=1 Tax=Tolypocladium capitatum TaxID=45235 RepID=A0A2K3QCS1_9HYPO|nr:Inter-alpha-trypsin inhibitor heavy chain H3 [Tolypocladium capitatum]
MLRSFLNMRLPLRNDAPPSYEAEPPSASSQVDGTALRLHPVPSKGALVVKVQPPEGPAADVHHVPCDIVLVIDISGSMGAAAPVPGENGSEDTGLTVLDLTKHAALTIIETLNDQDRLGIVTFGSKSKVIQDLEPMTDPSKAKARDNIKAMRPQDATNLWHGIRDAIRVFSDAGRSSRVPAMMVLTDGMPNHMCPPAGYIPKLRSMPPFPASIHTFGFGYSLRSGLLKSLAEFGGGNYAFIPDAGMIGTVFVHAVANLQSTFATEATLLLTYPAALEVEETMDRTVLRERPESIGSKEDNLMQLRIPLGNLQYGQSRDVFLRVRKVAKHDVNGDKEMGPPESNSVTATLDFKNTGTPLRDDKSKSRSRGFLKTGSGEAGPESRTVSVRCSVLGRSDLPESELAYHESRARICNHISSWFPLGSDGEHRVIANGREEKKKELAQLISEIPARNYNDEQNRSLMEDLSGSEPKGQISLAINNDSYFHKWGVHYLPSYCNAHSRQICNSFKDPGPLLYGVNSRLFIACRDRLDHVFDNLPAPEPTITYRSRSHHHSSVLSSAKGISMSKYRNSHGVCFVGSAPVELASGRMVPIRKLRRGTKVRTPAGPRKVALVLKTPVQREILCHVGSLAVTPWHPMSLDGKSWTFPAHVAQGTVRYTGPVYSVMLQRDTSAKAHAMRVGGAWGVTLGHGLTRGRDARAHAFFGDYNQVGKSLTGLGVDRFGVVEGGGVERDVRTGQVCGFRGKGAAGEAGAGSAPLMDAPLAQARVGVDSA